MIPHNTGPQNPSLTHVPQARAPDHHGRARLLLHSTPRSDLSKNGCFLPCGSSAPAVTSRSRDGGRPDKKQPSDPLEADGGPLRKTRRPA